MLSEVYREFHRMYIFMSKMNFIKHFIEILSCDVLSEHMNLVNKFIVKSEAESFSTASSGGASHASRVQENLTSRTD